MTDFDVTLETSFESSDKAFRIDGDHFHSSRTQQDATKLHTRQQQPQAMANSTPLLEPCRSSCKLQGSFVQHVRLDNRFRLALQAFFQPSSQNPLRIFLLMAHVNTPKLQKDCKYRKQTLNLGTAKTWLLNLITAPKSSVH